MDEFDIGFGDYDFPEVEVGGTSFDGPDEDRSYVRDRGPVLHEETWVDRKMISFPKPSTYDGFSID